MAWEEDAIAKEDDAIKKRKLDILEQRNAAYEALPFLPPKLGKNATEEQKQIRAALIDERVRKAYHIRKPWSLTFSTNR